MKAAIFLVTLLLFTTNACVVFNCQKPERHKEAKGNENSVTDVAKERFGNSFIIRENETKDYYLICNRPTGTETSIHFCVYNSKDEKVTFEDVIPLGKVSWSSPSLLLIESFPGTVKKDGNENLGGYYYNVYTGEKSSRSSNNKIK